MAEIHNRITQLQNTNIQQGVIIARLQQLQEGADTETTRKEGNNKNNCELKLGDEVTILTIGRFKHKTATIIKIGKTLVTLRLPTGQNTTRKSKNIELTK